MTMSKALAWIRKSKGSDDDIGLEMQREQVPGLAEELADEVDPLDLGVHTGFSSMSRDDDAGLLDQNDRVQQAVEKLEAGEYDYLVAYDDRRVCRDEYLRVIEYACKQGGCEFVYVGDVEEDDLAYDIHRRVERQTKEEEITKAKAALAERERKGYDQGRPPFGLQFDADGKYWVPDEDFDIARRVIELRDDDVPYREVRAKTGVPPSTAHGIMERREKYQEAKERTVTQ